MRLRCFGLSLALALVVAGALPVAAIASHAYVLKGSLGSPGSGDGQLDLVAPQLILVPRTAGSGVAVNDTSHDIYVGDTANHRVVQFSAAGTFIRAVGADVGGAGIDACTVGCVAGTPGSAPGAFETPTFVAVDNSGGASNGDLYVVDSATNVISKFEAGGTQVSSWGNNGPAEAPNGQLAGKTQAEPFGQIGGIAVDAAGNLDVFRSVSPRKIFKFTEAGAFSEELAIAGASSPGGLAVDPGGDFFKTSGLPTVEKLGPTGTDIGRVSIPEASGLGVDSGSGELFVDIGGSIDVYAFGPLGEVLPAGCLPTPAGSGCAPTESFGTGDLSAGASLGVDGASHVVYAADPGADTIRAFELVIAPEAITKAPSEVGPEEATLNATVNPEGQALMSNPAEGCFFEWGESTTYGNIAPCEEPNAFELGAGTSQVAVHADLEGLGAGRTYHYRIVAANAKANDKGEDEEFQTPGPTIGEEQAGDITSSAARITGTVNPNGKATSFAVEYVTEAVFVEDGYAVANVVPIPAREIGAGNEAMAVIQRLGGLEADTAYHFRLMASDSDGATARADDKTFHTLSPAPALLPDNRAYELVSPALKIGEVLTPEPLGLLGGSCIECQPSPNVGRTPMQSTPGGNAVAYEGQPFSRGFSSEANQYIASRESGGWASEDLSNPQFTIGHLGGFKAFSADLRRGVMLEGQPALSAQAPVDSEGRAFANLYLWEEGTLTPLITSEPPNRSALQETANAFALVLAGANAGTSENPAFSHIVFSADDALTGEVAGVVPTAPEVPASDCIVPGETCNLYEWDEGELRLVNVLPGNAAASVGAVAGSGRLLNGNHPLAEAPDADHAISDDGSRIFWSNEAGQVFVRINGEETREIEDPGKFVTASADGSLVLLNDGCLYEIEVGECAQQLGGAGTFEGILGAADDLSRVYFVDTAVLTGTEANANGEVSETGKDNLYVWAEGATKFIGRLLASDNENSGINGTMGDWRAAPGIRTARATADGRFLAFQSRARLTGYDNNVTGGGKECGKGRPQACLEVFEYDAVSEELVCASCSPTGLAPLGFSNLNLIRPTPSAPFPQPQNLGARGRLFFESQDVLSPKDTNGHIQDVYEWEPEGVGSCERADGCLFLISSGHSANDSMFMSATPSGDDVFFVTRERLVLQDKDEMLDLYDARVGGGIEAPETAPCEGEGCRGPVSELPQQPSPGSQSFSGPGNEKQAKHKRRRAKHRHKHRRHHHRRAAKHGQGGGQ